MKKSKPIKISKWLGTDDKMCADIVDKKYLLEEEILGHKESVDEMLDRVSGGNSDVKRLMLQRKFLPGGRIIANRGLNKYGLKVTYSNCYVDPAPEDSIESIYETCKRLARTFSYGGGIGIDISKLAPAGAIVRNTARFSTGAVSFIDAFSGVAETIGMHGRRGALMISIDGKHPDLEKFITHKSDLGETQGANMSVRFNDDFFKAVKENKDWVLEFTRPETGIKTEKVVNARDILMLIAKTNWDYAEPGVLFWDRITKYNLMSEDSYFSYAGTNPCVTGDTLILTDAGYFPIEILVGEKINIWNGYEWSEVVPKVTGKNQKILKIDFSDGSSIKCTRYHKFIMKSGEDVRIEAKDLKVGDYICGSEFPVIEGTIIDVNDKAMYTDGFTSGLDAEIKEYRGNDVIYLDADKIDLLHYLNYEKLCEQEGDSTEWDPLQESDAKYILRINDKYCVPTCYHHISARLSWLAGYIDANGAVDDLSGSISITSNNRDFIDKIKLMLNTLGCNGNIDTCKTDKYESPDNREEKCNCSSIYRLTINAFYVKKLISIGLNTHKLKIHTIDIDTYAEYPQVINISDLGIEPVVYCVTDELRHSVVFGGIRTANCGEEPLPAGGSCLLGAMNLSEYWNDKTNSFSLDSFITDVKIAVKYLNEVLDEGLQLHPLKEQRECVKKWRQIGLGIMGLADLFINAKVSYGSEESVKLCDFIGYNMIWAAIEESVELAKEYGHFDMCNSKSIVKSKFWIDNIESNPYFTDNDKDVLRSDILEYGMRNSQLLTCAPTGTISTILNISGGIEPMFALHYTRTTKSLYGRDKTYTVYPNAVKKYMDEEGISDIYSDELPFYMVTSRDIPWKDRIEVQAAWQRHIDASISATINLPEKTTVEEIAELYLTAHDRGLKGITVFRENCKRIAILNDTKSSKKKDANEKSLNCAECQINNISNQIDKKYEKSDNNKVYVDSTAVSVEDVKKKFLSSFDPILTRSDFGENLHGTTYYEKVACGHIYITVNRYAGRPVEVFMQSSKSGGCAANTEALGRLASTMLRAGIDPSIVVDSTLGVKCAACSTMKGKGEKISGLSCSDVMARVIRDEWNKYLDGYYDNEIQEYLDSNKKDNIDPGYLVKIMNDNFDSAIRNIATNDTENNITMWNFREHSIQENIDHYICPECGAALRFSEGCMKCDNCGFSKC